MWSPRTWPATTTSPNNAPRAEAMPLTEWAGVRVVECLTTTLAVQPNEPLRPILNRFAVEPALLRVLPDEMCLAGRRGQREATDKLIAAAHADIFHRGGGVGRSAWVRERMTPYGLIALARVQLPTQHTEEAVVVEMMNQLTSLMYAQSRAPREERQAAARRASGSGFFDAAMLDQHTQAEVHPLLAHMALLALVEQEVALALPQPFVARITLALQFSVLRTLNIHNTSSVAPSSSSSMWGTSMFACASCATEVEVEVLLRTLLHSLLAVATNDVAWAPPTTPRRKPVKKKRPVLNASAPISTNIKKRSATPNTATSRPTNTAARAPSPPPPAKEVAHSPTTSMLHALSLACGGLPPPSAHVELATCIDDHLHANVVPNAPNMLGDDFGAAAREVVGLLAALLHVAVPLAGLLASRRTNAGRLVVLQRFQNAVEEELRIHPSSSSATTVEEMLAKDLMHSVRLRKDSGDVVGRLRGATLFVAAEQKLGNGVEQLWEHICVGVLELVELLRYP